MDRHVVAEDFSALQAAALHILDQGVQAEHGARFLTYWIDEKEGQVHCLVDAPSAEAAEAVHAASHGNIAAEIMPVDWDDVEQWLGPVDQTAASETNFREEEAPSEPALRTIFFSDMEGFTATTQRIGDEAAMVVLQAHDTVIRDALSAHRGREVKHTGDGMMASFQAASDGVECAMRIQRELAKQSPDLPAAIHVRIGLSAGEPVASHQDLFGAAVNLASRVCDQADAGQIFVASVVRDLCIGKQYDFASEGLQELKGFDDPIQLFQVNWQD
jgi:class 3 adenylate cyclase